MFTFLESSTLSRKMKLAARMETGLLEIKSKFDAEFRRFSIDLKKDWSLESFQNFVRDVHRLHNIPFDLTYTDHEGDLLPLNNEENFHHALNVCRPLLRLVIQHKGSLQYGYGTVAHGRKNIISRLLEGDHQVKNYPCKNISQPENFRCVSAIIDVDILPATQRRVKLMKSQSDKPLGFFVRDGYSIHPTSTGQLERIPGIFISRLVPGGLAASTGLLAVNDEVLEVNGIEVAGKTLDQVTDMMVANSSNLIITIKPCNQHTNIKMNDDEDDLVNFRPMQNNNSNKAATDSDTAPLHDNNNNNFSDEEDDVKDFVRQDPSGCSNTNSIILQQQQQILPNQLQQKQQIQQFSQQQLLLNQQSNLQNQLGENPQQAISQQSAQHQRRNSQSFNNKHSIKSVNVNNNYNVVNNSMINNNNINSNNNNNNSLTSNNAPQSFLNNFNQPGGFDDISFKSNSRMSNSSQRSNGLHNQFIQQANNHSFNTKQPFRNDLRSSNIYKSDLSLNSNKAFYTVNDSNDNNNSNNNNTPIRRSFKEYNNNNINTNFNINNNNGNNRIIINSSNSNNKYNELMKHRSKQQLIVTNLQSLNDLDDYDAGQLRFVEGNAMHTSNADCNQFTSSKSNDFYNYTNSSLRIIPNKYRNMNSADQRERMDGREDDHVISSSSSLRADARASSRSVDHHLMSRKKQFQF